MSQPLKQNSQGFPSTAAPFVDDEKRIIQPWYQLLSALWQRTGGGSGSLTTPSGTLAGFAGSVAPGGWLLCDGSAVSRFTYSFLFAAIGTTWGTGDGSSTFNLPDFRGRMILGVSGSYALASKGGSATTVQSVSQMPPHMHPLTDPGHFHTALVASSTNTAGAAAGTGVSGSTSTEVTGITMGDTGGGMPMTTISPYAAALVIIKI